MRALFTSLPATGHFNSTLPLALAMRDAGHDVAMCCAPEFGDRASSLGFRHFVGGGRSLEEFLPAEYRESFGPSRKLYMRLQVFARLAPDRLMPDLVRAVDTWQPDVLLRESTEYAACVLAERRGLPHAAVVTNADGSGDEVRRFFARSLSALRERHGLPSDPGAEMMHRYLTISLMPAAWDGDAVVPPTLHRLRYEYRQDGIARPDWLNARQSRPLVLASLGTLMYGERGVLEAIIEALGALEVEAVVAIGRDTDPGRFGRVSANVRLEPYVPQFDVLSRASLFITHGGFNSAKEALSLGVPLVVIPISADQPHTAARVEALGLGRAVARDERTADVIRHRAAAVLQDSAFRSAAAGFAAEMAALPPLEHGVRLVERLASERRPIPRDALTP